MFLLSKSAASFALGAFFVLACNPALADCPPFGKTSKVTIAKVIDGDTVRLADGRKVRLIGVNAPELGRDNKPDQPYAQKATDELKHFFNTKSFDIKSFNTKSFDTKSFNKKSALLLTGRDRRDNHGRTLAHLYNLNGESAEAHLLSKGLAWHVAIPPNLTMAECLADAEKQARQQHLGLWSSAGIKPTKAKQVSHGGFQIVTGTVTEVRFTKSGCWINLGPRIAAVIYREHQHRFDRKQLEALKGKTVSVRGWVYPSRSKKYQPWRVKLETVFGLKVE
ncbi:thermonuclease family protein [Porticoccus sp. GXU_MW_L64]